MMSKFFHVILNFLFPCKCLGCEKKDIILCSDCLTRIDYPTLLKSNNILAATDYNDELAKKAIWLLKYRGIKQLAEPLAELIKQRILIKIKIKNHVFIPVLYKTRETNSQVSQKDREKRLNNLKDSFGVKNPKLVAGKNIILIDDVSTTGATIGEAKKVLREAGAKSIIALVVARG
ncbi:MAG: phosphoribosyltransferase family protein [Candidatus Parcubacteria bacterium]|nr:phosphoribosyltransferase family protein [Candidatus Parcubacteria bacterium]